VAESTHDLDGHLTQLARRGLLQPAPDSADLEYLFRHALIQDAAYAGLLRTDRRTLHHQVAQALEALYPERRADLAAQLAHHFAAAGQDATARGYYEQAADRALSSYSNEEAAAHYQAALTLARAPADQARLHAGRAEALGRLGHVAEATHAWQTAIAAYTAAADGAGLARTYTGLMRLTFKAGDTPGTLAYGAAALAALAPHPESPAQIGLFQTLAHATFLSGDPAGAHVYAEQARLLAQRAGDATAEIEILIMLGTLAKGDREQRLLFLAAAAQRAEAAGRLDKASQAHQNTAFALVELGDLPGARQHYAHMTRLAHQQGHVSDELLASTGDILCAIWLGEYPRAAARLAAVRQLAIRGDPLQALAMSETLLHYYQGARAAATARLTGLVAQLQAAGNFQVWLIGVYMLTDLLLDQGAWVHAQTMLAGVRPVSTRGVAFGRAWAHYQSAEVAAALSDRAAAAQFLATAHTLAGPAPSRPDQAGLQRATARLAAAEGRWAAAAAAFAAAAASYGAMGRPWEQAQLWRAEAAARRAGGAPDDPAAATLDAAATACFAALGVPAP